MGKVVFPVESDESGVVGSFVSAYWDARRFKGSGAATSPAGKVKKFLAYHPEHRRVPRTFLRGIFRYGEPVTEDLTGLNLSGDTLKVHLMGEVRLARSVKGSIVNPRRLGISGFNQGTLTIYGTPLRRRTEPGATDIPLDTAFGEIRKQDNIVDFLSVNLVPPDRAMWRKREALAYVRDNPDLTRQEIEELGITSDWDWDLLVDFQEGMQEILRAPVKPEGCNILSKNQIRRRQDREYHMPDTINDNDSDKGNLSKQSYDPQIYQALFGNRYDFLT